jgi:hypothetical protein
VAIGRKTLYSNTTGIFNTAVGQSALRLNTTGGNNTAMGDSALYSNTTGANNTALGYAAGDNITTGSSNIIIGSGVDAPSATASNQLNIGNTIYGDLSNDNVGIGVVPYTGRVAGNAALDIKHFGELSGDGDGARYGFNLAMNAYNTGGADPGNWKVKSASVYGSTLLQQRDGTFNFYSKAGASAADTAISWTTAMTINNSGNVEYGTFSSSGATEGGLLNANGRIDISKSTTSSVTAAKFYNPNGQVGSIGVSGSATSYNTSSDYRLKENVVPMTGSIDRLKDLKPSRFNFKADTDKTVDGFLAHEAGEVVPECATGTKDAMMDEEYEVTPAVMDGETVVTEAVMGTRSVPDYQGIDQSKLVPLLVASLQEAIARIEVLENA